MSDPREKQLDSLVFVEAIKVLERNELIPVNITVLEESFRSEPNPHTPFTPLGHLGVRIKVKNEHFGEKIWFLKHQNCEDLLTYGDHIGTEMLKILYKPEWDDFLDKYKDLLK